jgi:hypothetical protein
MKKVLFLSMLLCIAALGNTQRVYFMYLQSDNGAPFYIKMGDKIHSSSSIGYLVLPNLKDSSYSFRVGIPSLSKEEPLFNVTVSNNDRGFLLKNFDKGLSLFDLNSLEIISAQAAAQTNHAFTTRNDNFTKTLSQASNDPSLLIDVVKQETPKPMAKPALIDVKSTTPIPVEDVVTKSNNRDTSKLEVAIIESKVITNTSVDTISKVTDFSSSVMTEPVKEVKTEIPEKNLNSTNTNSISDATAIAIADQTNEQAPAKTINDIIQEYKKSTVIRRSESSTSEGFGLTYIDQQMDGSDTIRLLIPNPKIQLKAEPLQSQVQEEQRSEVQAVQPVLPTVNNEKEVLVKQKSACTNLASNVDFKRLRKDMAAQDTDDAMLAKASRVFRSKCFTTEQVKNLSALFLSASGKYRFFDAAFTSVSDQDQFSTLQTELADEYYINRFKALIAK